jgi:CDP-diglyceride synthetase
MAGSRYSRGSCDCPWLSAGVLSALAIALASIWLLWRLRRNNIRRTRMVGAVQWGAPAMTFAAVFLMADRPQNVAAAVAPIAIAVAVAAFAAFTTARGGRRRRRAADSACESG